MKQIWGYDIEIGCANGEDFWYCAMQFNGLFHLDLTSGKSEFIGSIPNEDRYKDRLFGGMHYYNDNIYLIPFSAKYISVFNIKTKTYKQFEVLAPTHIPERYNTDYKWQGSVLVNKKIYMFGLTHSAIGIFDLEKESIDYDYRWIEALNRECNINLCEIHNKFWFEKSVACNESGIYVSMGILNAVLKIDTNDDKYHFIWIGESEDRFYNIKLLDTYIILFYKEKKDGLIIYNLVSGQIQRSLNVADEVNITNAEMIKYKDKLLIVPLKKSGIIETTIEFDEFKRITVFENKNCMYYLHDFEYDAKIIFYTKSDKHITYFEDINDYHEYELYTDANIINLLRMKCLVDTSNGICYETKDNSINHFLDALTNC